MIKNIYFDMGGVIFDQNTEEAFRRFRSLGIDTDYYMGVYGQRDFFLDLETGRIDADTFCQRVGEVVGHAVSREQARDCWLGFFDGVPVERLDDLVTLRTQLGHRGLIHTVGNKNTHGNNLLIKYVLLSNFAG